MQSLASHAYARNLVIAAIFLSALTACAQQQTSVAQDPHLAAIANLPITFEINRGQTSEQVHFLYHGSRLQMFFTDSGAVLNLVPPQAKAPKTAPQVDGVAVFMKFAGDHVPVIEAEQTVQGDSNYLVGPPDQWRTHIAHYARVRYRNVAPGIDVVFYGNQKNLEYDWIVSAGADPSQVRMHFDGTKQIFLDRSGNLILRTTLADIEQKRPTAYQQLGNRRAAVPTHYVVSGSDVRLVVGPYDRRRALTVDPVLAYASFLGGSAADTANAITVDGSGSTYIAGTTSSLNFPVTPGAYQTHLIGNPNAFVSKFNSNGTALEYSSYFGGNGYYWGNGLAVDSSGNAYLSGQVLNSTNFPGKIIGTMNPNIFTAYLAKLNSEGSALVYGLAWGGATDGCSSPFGFGTAAYAVAVDQMGRAWATGATSTTDFPTTMTAYQHTWGGGCDAVYPILGDAFVSVVSPDGTELAYSTYIGGQGLDWGHAIALDGKGNAYITGANVYGGYPTTLGTFMPNYPSTTGGASGIVTKISTGPILGYSTYLGGSDQSQGSGISLDSNGDAFITGWTTTTDFPTTPGAFKRTFSSKTLKEVYVTKMNPIGSALVYSTFLGNGTGNGIAVAPDTGLAFAAGWTDNSTGDFPITRNAFQKVLRDSYGN